MIVIYYKSDGEIYQVAIGYSSFEEYYGKRAEEFSQIFDCIAMESNDYIFNKFSDFRVDTETKELVLNNIQMYEIFKNTQKVRGGKNGKKRN